MTKSFSHTDPIYNMSTYSGRLQYFYRSIDPRMMMENSASLAAHRELLKQHKQGTWNKANCDAQLWQSRFALEACTHPGTGKEIFPLFRMSAFIPVNIFIVPYMMLPSTVASVGRTIGIHWFNQSFNAVVNYANRSGDEQPLTTLGQAYAAAVMVSVAGALGATFVVRRMGQSPAATIARAVIPMCAVAFSGSANLAMMRWSEWTTVGVDVRDEDGTVRGKSVTAGRISLAECSSARVLWNIPCMMLPPLLAAPLMRNVPLLGSNPVLTETMLILMGLGVGVAPALAAFPPLESVRAVKLEPHFQSLLRANGQPVETLRFVKGL